MPRLTSDNPESVITRVIDDEGDEAMVEPGVVRPERIFVMTTDQGAWLTAEDADDLGAALQTLAARLRATTLAA